jgi:hypothetical protein
MAAPVVQRLRQQGASPIEKTFLCNRMRHIGGRGDETVSPLACAQ